MRDSWQIYALGSALFAALTAVWAKIGVTGISSNAATLIRTLIICIFLGFLVSIRGEWTNPFTLNKRSLMFLFLSAIATGLSWICYFRALQMGPAFGVVSLDKLSLIFSVLLAVSFLGEHLGWQQWGGIILMTCGALLVTLKP